MAVLTLPSGAGMVVQSEALPLIDLKALGVRWVLIAWGPDRTIEEIEALIKHYVTMPIVLLAPTLPHIEIAASRKWSVLKTPFNEPDLKQGVFYTPSQIVNSYNKLHALGIDIIGPNICNLNYSAAWWNEFMAICPSWLQVLTVHGYGLSVADLRDRMAKLAAVTGKRVICTEAGGKIELSGDGFAANAIEVIQSGITAAIYQGPTGLWDMVNGVWTLNAGGSKVKAAVVAMAQVAGKG